MEKEKKTRLHKSTLQNALDLSYMIHSSLQGKTNYFWKIHSLLCHLILSYTYTRAIHLHHPVRELYLKASQCVKLGLALMVMVSGL